MWERYSDSSVGYGLDMCGSVSQLPAGRRFLSSPFSKVPGSALGLTQPPIQSGTGAT